MKNDTSASNPHGPGHPGAAGQYPVQVRLTEFWARMRAQFGDVYAQSVAKDYVFAKLGGRTIERALADGDRRETPKHLRANQQLQQL